MTDPAPEAPRALHPKDGLRPGGWYACEHPERPPKVELTAFDPRCNACTIALDACRRLAGKDLVVEQRTTRGVELVTKVTADGRLAQAAARRRR